MLGRFGTCPYLRKSKIRIEVGIDSFLTLSLPGDKMVSCNLKPIAVN
jgi:hypothetical protein